MSDKKYILTDNTKIEFGIKLFQIKAIKSFDDVQKGDFGGWIEKESNLSHEGNCWVFGNGRVYDNGQVYGNGLVFDNGLVYDNGQVFDNGLVYGNGQVFDNGLVYDNGQVYDNGRVCGDGLVYGNGQVYDNGRVCGDGQVYGNGQVYGSVYISSGNTDFDVKKNIRGLIQNSTNLSFLGNKLIAYKVVRQISKNVFVSLHDPSFKYTKFKYSEVKDFDPNWDKSCASGIHVSNFNYWTSHKPIGKEYVYIAVEVDIKDVITCQEGKIRCKKVKTLGVCATE